MYSIIYLTLGGGKFLGQILTAGLEKIDKEYFDFYDDDHIDWMSREDNFHYNDKITMRGTHSFSFNEIAKLPNLIFVSVSDDESKEKIIERNKYISTSMDNNMIMDVRMKYHHECLNFLKTHNVDFFEIRHIDFWRYETFLKITERLEKHFNLSFNNDVLKYAHKKWIKSNIKRRGTLNDK